MLGFHSGISITNIKQKNENRKWKQNSFKNNNKQRINSGNSLVFNHLIDLSNCLLFFYLSAFLVFYAFFFPFHFIVLHYSECSLEFTANRKKNRLQVHGSLIRYIHLKLHFVLSRFSILFLSLE